jgi:hypothetical protein
LNRPCTAPDPLLCQRCGHHPVPASPGDDFPRDAHRDLDAKPAPASLTTSSPSFRHLLWLARSSVPSNTSPPQRHQEPPIPAQPRSRYRGVRRRPSEQQAAFDEHLPTGRKSGPAPRRTKPQDAAPQDRLQVTSASMVMPSATSRSFPFLPNGSSNPSNAPAQLRRAHVPGESTPHVPRPPAAAAGS